VGGDGDGPATATDRDDQRSVCARGDVMQHKTPVGEAAGEYHGRPRDHRAAAVAGGGGGEVGDGGVRDVDERIVEGVRLDGGVAEKPERRRRIHRAGERGLAAGLATGDLTAQSRAAVGVADVWESAVTAGGAGG